MYRMTAKTPIGEMPFRLVYGSEVVILAEVGLKGYKAENHDENRNDKAIHLQL